MSQSHWGGNGKKNWSQKKQTFDPKKEIPIQSLGLGTFEVGQFRGWQKEGEKESERKGNAEQIGGVGGGYIRTPGRGGQQQGGHRSRGKRTQPGAEGWRKVVKHHEPQHVIKQIANKILEGLRARDLRRGKRDLPHRKATFFSENGKKWSPCLVLEGTSEKVRHSKTKSAGKGP